MVISFSFDTLAVVPNRGAGFPETILYEPIFHLTAIFYSGFIGSVLACLVYEDIISVFYFAG